MKNKIWHIALSVVIAFALWVYVITTVSPESEDTFYDIPVTYQNDILDERGLMIVSDTPTVTLHLKGNRSDLNELNASNITILVNLAGIQAPGTQMVNYDIKFPGNIPDNAIETLSQSPNILKLKVENKIKKNVPVVLEYMGSVPEGYIDDRENPVMDTAYVEVSGPESAVMPIEQARIQVDLSGRTDSVVDAFAYELCNAEAEPVDAESVTTNVEEGNLSVKIQQMKEVPLTLNVVAGGGATEGDCKIELSQQTVWVCGTETKLRDLDAVELGTVELAQLQKDSNTLEFEIVLPEGVTNVTGETKVTATVTFPELGKRKLSVSMDRFFSTGVPEGAAVTWITQVIELELRGNKQQIQKLTEKDITVTLDFTDEALGSINKVPKITLGSDYDSVGALSVPAITASLQEAVQDGTEG